MKKLFLFTIFIVVLFCFLGTNTPNVKAATIEELQAQIQALLAQITQLQKELAQMQGQPVVWCYDFSRNLKFGMTGTEVRALQTALQKEGFYERVINSTFDEYTASAVVGFQEKYTNEILTPWGLKYGTGYVGSTTRAKLNAIYGCKIPVVPITPSITVLSPNGGEKWTIGNNYDITWSSTGVNKVNIELIRGNNTAHLAYNILASTGKYSWKVEDLSSIGFIPSNDYKITIWDAEKSNIIDQSDNYFSIMAAVPALPDLVISKLSASPTSAAVGEKIRLTFTIKNIGNVSANVDWSYTNQVDGTSSRPLSSTCSGSSLVQDRCDTCSGAVLKPDYSCQVERDFTFPTAGSKLMQVSVDPTNAVTELDETNNGASLYLDITKKGTITVTSPNGGEQWTTEGSSAFQGDRVYKISWSTTGDVYEKVDILLGGYDQSGNQIDDWKLIKAGASTSQGYHYWTPARDPLYLPSGFSVTPNKYKVKIREATDKPDAITDTSDDYFSIVTADVGLENIQNQLASISNAISELMERIKGLMGR